MLGNWATGKVRMVSEPTSTMMMEITIATIGRLIKNFDMELPVLGSRTKWLGVHSRAGAHFLSAFCDDPFSGMQPTGNNPLPANRVPHRNGSNGHFVVTIDDRNLVAPLE